MWLYPIIDGGLPVLMNMSRPEFSNDTTHVMIRSLICLSVPFFKYFFFFPFSLFSLLNFNANFYFSLLVRASCSSSFFLFDRLISFPLGFLLFGFIWAQAQMDTLSALFFQGTSIRDIVISIHQLFPTSDHFSIPLFCLLQERLAKRAIDSRTLPASPFYFIP